MKQLWRDHGWVFVGSYVVAYAASFAAAWGAIVIARLDGIDVLRRLGFDGIVDTDKLSPKWVNAFIAMTIADAVEPVRLPLVILATPFISGALRKRRGR